MNTSSHFSEKESETNAFFKEIILSLKTRIKNESDITNLTSNFSKLLKNNVPLSHCLWDVAFYLLITKLIIDLKFTEKQLNPILKIWGRLNRPKEIVFHKEYIVPEYWDSFFYNANLRKELQQYFNYWIDHYQDLDWKIFFENLQSHLGNYVAEMNEQQFLTLLKILELQTDSNIELEKYRVNRSSQSISRDKKFLYDKRILIKSLWLDFSKIGLTQKDLIIIYKPLSKIHVKLNENSPWLFSKYHASIGQNIETYTLLAPKTLDVEKRIETLVYQIMNTADVIEVYVFEPNFSRRPHFVSLNYSNFNPYTRSWNFPLGYPKIYLKGNSFSRNAIPLGEKLDQYSSKKTDEKFKISKELMLAINTFYKQGRLSIRELKEELGITFHKARNLIDSIDSLNILGERFSSTIGSSLATIFALFVGKDIDEKKIMNFGSYLPEQYLLDVKGINMNFYSLKLQEIIGMRGIFRVPPRYVEDTIDSLKTLIESKESIIFQLISAKETNWEIPVDRWDEEKQEWIIEENDFLLNT